jgi:hypothetical protein
MTDGEIRAEYLPPVYERKVERFEDSQRMRDHQAWLQRQYEIKRREWRALHPMSDYQHNNKEIKDAES